jgi:amidase
VPEDAVSCWARLIMGDFGSVLGMLAPMMGPDATAFVHNFNEAVPPLADVAAWSHLMVERDGIARVTWIGSLCFRKDLCARQS